MMHKALSTAWTWSRRLHQTTLSRLRVQVPMLSFHRLPVFSTPHRSLAPGFSSLAGCSKAIASPLTPSVAHRACSGAYAYLRGLIKAQHLFAADELELEGGGGEEGLQGQAARAVAGLRGAALGRLHDLAHRLLQVLLVCDGDQVRFPAGFMAALSLQLMLMDPQLSWLAPHLSRNRSTLRPATQKQCVVVHTLQPARCICPEIVLALIDHNFSCTAAIVRRQRGTCLTTSRALRGRIETDLSRYLIWKGQALGNFCLTLSSSSA